jgi:hypothetical protein
MNHEELATAIAGSLEIKTEMGRQIIPIALECIDLFDRKQQDYGSKNIASFEDKDMNMLGVAIRLNDKVQRMMNLLANRVKGKGEPNNESIKDNSRDIHNYGTILSALEQGIWK